MGYTEVKTFLFFKSDIFHLNLMKGEIQSCDLVKSVFKYTKDCSYPQ